MPDDKTWTTKFLREINPANHKNKIIKKIKTININVVFEAKRLYQE